MRGKKKRADGEVGPVRRGLLSCCFSICVVAVKIVNVGRVYMGAKMHEVLGIVHLS